MFLRWFCAAQRCFVLVGLALCPQQVTPSEHCIADIMQSCTVRSRGDVSKSHQRASVVAGLSGAVKMLSQHVTQQSPTLIDVRCDTAVKEHQHPKSH